MQPMTGAPIGDTKTVEQQQMLLNFAGYPKANFQIEDAVEFITAVHGGVFNNLSVSRISQKVHHWILNIM